MLDTALAGIEDYDREIFRLFRDLHDNDPLRRKCQPELTIKRLFEHTNNGPSSAASSVAPSLQNLSCVYFF